jgi:hypothetical protein
MAMSIKQNKKVKIIVIFDYDKCIFEIDNFHRDYYRDAIDSFKGEEKYFAFMNQKFQMLDKIRYPTSLKHYSIVKMIERNIQSVNNFVFRFGEATRLVQRLPIDLQRYISEFVHIDRPKMFFTEMVNFQHLIKNNIRISQVKTDCCSCGNPYYMYLDDNIICQCQCKCGESVSECNYKCYK